MVAGGDAVDAYQRWDDHSAYQAHNAETGVSQVQIPPARPFLYP
jgi:hypothetical protein